MGNSNAATGSIGPAPDPIGALVTVRQFSEPKALALDPVSGEVLVLCAAAGLLALDLTRPAPDAHAMGAAPGRVLASAARRNGERVSRYTRCAAVNPLDRSVLLVDGPFVRRVDTGHAPARPGPVLQRVPTNGSRHVLVTPCGTHALVLEQSVVRLLRVDLSTGQMEGVLTAASAAAATKDALRLQRLEAMCWDTSTPRAGQALLVAHASGVFRFVFPVASAQVLAELDGSAAAEAKRQRTGKGQADTLAPAAGAGAAAVWPLLPRELWRVVAEYAANGVSFTPLPALASAYEALECTPSGHVLLARGTSVELFDPVTRKVETLAQGVSPAMAQRERASGLIAHSRDGVACADPNAHLSHDTPCGFISASVTHLAVCPQRQCVFFLSGQQLRRLQLRADLFRAPAPGAGVPLAYRDAAEVAAAASAALFPDAATAGAAAAGGAV